MVTTDKPHIIKGAPVERWQEVQAIQHEPFIYIMGNGSKWAGQEEDDIEKLLEVLGKYALDYETFTSEFYTLNPCRWANNPKATPVNGQPRWIDGERLYKVYGVYRFWGNFRRLSHGFNIDTSHEPTIKALIDAIEDNRHCFRIGALD